MIDILMSLVIFDLDNTIIRGQSQLYLLFFARKKRLINLVDFIVTLLWFAFYKLNLVKDPQVIINYVYKKVLDDKSIDEMSVMFTEFFSSILKFKIIKSVCDLLKEHQQKSDRVVIMSNAIEPIAREIAKYLGVEECIATKLKCIDRTFTGDVEGEIVYGQHKADLARKLFGEALISDATFYSDHHSDIPLFELVKNRRVVNPDKILLKTANARLWQVINI